MSTTQQFDISLETANLVCTVLRNNEMSKKNKIDAILGVMSAFLGQVDQIIATIWINFFIDCSPLKTNEQYRIFGNALDKFIESSNASDLYTLIVSATMIEGCLTSEEAFISLYKSAKRQSESSCELSKMQKELSNLLKNIISDEDTELFDSSVTNCRTRVAKFFELKNLCKENIFKCFASDQCSGRITPTPTGVGLYYDDKVVDFPDPVGPEISIIP